MKKLIIGFFCFFSLGAQAEVQVQVDSSQVQLDESFNLILTQENPPAGSGGIPDLTPLRKDFVILGTGQSVNYSVINGQTQSASTWTISLQAKKEGTITIPPIKIGKEETQPLSLEVTAAHLNQTNTQLSNQTEDLFLTAEVNEKKPYVNQQIIYKVTLYNSKQLLDASYQGPKVENALLIPLGGEKHYQTQKNNTQYLVEEQNYAIFPQKSGPIKISSPVFSALVYDFNPQRVTAESKPVTLNVQPVPKSYSGNEWLPAKKIQLSETYENAQDRLTEGSTLIRTVILEGVGIPAQLLPNLNFAEAHGFSVYPEKGKDKNQVVQSDISSSITIKVTYLFNKSGQVTIPDLKLPWFNTNTGKEEFASLPAKTIEIAPATAKPSAKNSQPTSVVNESPLSPAKEKPSSSRLMQIDLAWCLVSIFAAAWIITLILWANQKRNKNKSKGRYKKALHKLHEACIHGNPQQARDALLTWASLHWPDASILNLTELKRLASDINLKKQIQILSEVLYKNTERSLWRGDELWHSIQGIKQTHTQPKGKTDDLPPINPS